MLKRNSKYFHLGFERTEQQEVLDSRQKSINATSWPQNGVEGLIRKTIVMTSELATCLFAPVFQDLECFAFTLAENISMKDMENTDLERAEKLAIKVGLDEKLKEWKDGIRITKIVLDRRTKMEDWFSRDIESGADSVLAGWLYF